MGGIIIAGITLVLIVFFTVLTQISTSCPMCDTGKTTQKTCETCGGWGKMPGTAIGPGQFARCATCEGNGYVEICAFCKGERQVSLLNWISAKLTKKKFVRF